MQQEESEAPSVRNTYTMAITREKVKYPPCAHVKRKLMLLLLPLLVLL